MILKPKIQDLLPPTLLKIIRDRIKSGIVDAEKKFTLNQDDEDSITGALAQAISTSEGIVFSEKGSFFRFEIQTFKIRGRGPRAPEKTLGADGILQLSVSKNGSTVFSKGLPFQAKKACGPGNAGILSQARKLLSTAETGAVIWYSVDGYTAMDVRDVLAVKNPESKRTRMPRSKLTTVFGDCFIDCEIGKIGLTYDRESVGPQGIGSWVIDAQISHIT